jgi:DNA-binding MarR family transcriptional regulator
MVARVPDPKRQPRPQRPPVTVAFLLAQIGTHAATGFGERLEPLKLTRPHAGILGIVGAAEGLTQQALGERLGILPSRLVVLIDDLEARGLVERRDSAEDRRRYALHLTTKGRQATETLARLAQEHEAAVCRALDPAEREQLRSLLTKVAEDQGLVPGVHPGFKHLGRTHRWSGEDPRAPRPRSRKR